MIKSFFVAFSLYSVIPMPKTQWTDKSMRYALCFFPFVGIVIGIAVYFASRLMIYMNFGKIFYSIIMTIIPVIITGGIHIDGFLDTIDAISSYADKEKRLEILKDPNCGAFAVIWGIVYFAANAALWSEVDGGVIIVSIGYVLSRSLSALSIKTFPKARQTGLVSEFSKSADKRVSVIMCIYIIIEIIIMLILSAQAAVFALCGAAAAFTVHIINCKKNFGGITGDLAGFFLQICELFILMGVITAYRTGAAV